jgi:Tol biopolymer transport system component
VRTLIALFVGFALLGACAPGGPTARTARPIADETPTPTSSPTAPATPTSSPTSPTPAVAATPQAAEAPGAIPEIPGTYADAGPWILFQAVFGTPGAAPPDVGLMRPDGSDAHRVPGAQYERWHPYWSPDGTMIAYDRYPTNERGGLAIMGPDGSDDRWLLECTEPCLGINAPAWAPDGSSVIFEGIEGAGWDDPERVCHLGLVDVNSGDVSYLLEEVGCAFSYMTPRFSPDGERIVVKRIDESTKRADLYTVAADGTDLQQLTDGGARADWSPDGEWIVFQGDEHEGPFERAIHLYRVRADGSDRQQLTDAPGANVADAYPRWLPDGSAILFSRCIGGWTCQTRLIDPDGSNDRLLVPAFGQQVIHPIWQPPAP